MAAHKGPVNQQARHRWPMSVENSPKSDLTAQLDLILPFALAKVFTPVLALKLNVFHEIPPFPPLREAITIIRSLQRH